jgi:hypothetical protein
MRLLRLTNDGAIEKNRPTSTMRSTLDRMRVAHAAAVAVLVTLFAGCAPDERSSAGLAPRDAAIAGPEASRDAARREASPPPAPPPTYAPTFVALFDEVLSPRCGSPFCHGADGYFTLATRDLGYASLVGEKATSQDCADSGLLRVAPFHPEASLLYLKVTSPPCGRAMPLRFGSSGPLDSRQIAQIEEWIARGAPYGGADAGAPSDGAASASVGDGGVDSEAPKTTVDAGVPDAAIDTG